MSPATAVVWSLVRGETRGHLAVPGAAGITIPPDVIDWAISHGLDDTDPDVWVGVTPEDEAGEVVGEIAYRSGTVDGESMSLLRAHLS
jgi:hypothetical protein